jgi:hypothetical protein
LQSLLGLFGQGLFGWSQQVGVGRFIPSTHSTSQLVEIGKTVSIGPIDEDGVGIRNIDATFDDGGGEKKMELALLKSVKDLFDFFGIHLSMDDTDLESRDQVEELLALLFECSHPVVDEKDLPFSSPFS